MANEPISQLTTTATASATDVVPIVSQGITQKVALRDLAYNSAAPIYTEPYFYQSGSWLSFKGSANYFSAGVINTLYVYPFVLSVASSFNAAAIYVSTAGNSIVTMALYGSNAFNMPNTLVANLGTVPCSADIQETSNFSSNVSLLPGVYWVGAVIQSGTIPILFGYALNTSMHTLPVPTLSATPAVGYQMNNVTGSLPTTFVINSSTASVPRIWLKYV